MKVGFGVGVGHATVWLVAVVQVYLCILPAI